MSVNRKYHFLLVALFFLALPIHSHASTGKYIDIGDGLEIYYEEAGQGTPLIFIPGWTMTTGFFEKQLDFFSKKYRTIVYDPRGQGRSTKTLDGNNYEQRGIDLKKFTDALGIKNVTLAGWSFGALDIYSYVKKYGTGNLKAIIFIDQGPKSLPEKEGDWAIGDAKALKGFMDGINHTRRAYTEGFLKWTVTRELTTKELQWMIDESLKTPTFVAVLMIADGWLSNYTDVVPKLSVPVLNVVREDWAPQAKKYLQENLPKSEVFILGKHSMFWEFPDKFNEAVDKFLNTAK